MFLSSADFVPGGQMLLLEFSQIRQGNNQVVMGKEFHSVLVVGFLNSLRGVKSPNDSVNRSTPIVSPFPSVA